MEATTDRLKTSVHPDIEAVAVKAIKPENGDDRQEALDVDGERFALVILATGVTLDPASTPLFENVRVDFPASFVGGFPELDQSLRWSDAENIFVVGCNAGLQLGPGALNLMGAMRSGQLVAEELHELMWKDTRKHQAKLEYNVFSMLAVDDCFSETDESEDED